MNSSNIFLNSGIKSIPKGSPKNVTTPTKIHPSKLLSTLMSPIFNNSKTGLNLPKRDSATPITPFKTPLIKRFTVTSTKKFKEHRSLSPIMKYRVEEMDCEKKVFEKYRVLRTVGQDREIKVQKLVNILKQPENTDIKVKIGYMMEIIELAISGLSFEDPIFNEIPSFLRENIFCNNSETLLKLEKSFQIESLSLKNELYSSIVRVFCEKFSHSKKKHEKILEDFKANSSFLENSLKEKSEQLTNLENQYKEKYESQQIKLSQEVAKANDKISLLTNEKNNCVSTISRLKEELLTTQNTWQHEKELIFQDFNQKIKFYESKNEQYIKDLEEKEVSFRDESAKNSLVYQNYQRSVHLLKTLKEKLDKKEAEVHEKMNENHRLKVRAAAAWEEFTPRPSFKPFIELLMLEEEEFKNKSTIDVVGGIFSHVEERLRSFATKSPNSSPKTRAFKRSNTPIYSEKFIAPNKNPSKIKNPAVKKRQTIKLENDKIKKLDTFSMKDL